MSTDLYQGDVREAKSNAGRFRKGEHRSPATEFQKGMASWRPHQVFRERAYLEQEYVGKGRSAAEIAGEFGVTEAAIFFWLSRHGIPRRSVREARQVKHWGAAREQNPMWGKRGPESPHWKGGVTPERQRIYSKVEWREAVESIWLRDRGVCQRCGTKGRSGHRMHVHHLVPFAQAPLRMASDDLVLLCSRCHGFVHSRKNMAGEFVRKGGDEE